MKEEIVQLWNFSAENCYREKVKDINLLIREGECHLLWGKDYTGRTLAGIFKNQKSIASGEMRIRTVRVRQCDRELLERNRIYYVDGETEFMESLDLAENLFLLKKNSLKKLWLNEKAIHIQADALLKKYGLPFETESRMDRLSASDKILLALVGAAAQGARLIVLNNVSTVYSKKDTDIITDVLTRMKEEGVSFLIYDSHPEIFTDAADCLVIMKQGRIIKKIWEPEKFSIGFEIAGVRVREDKTEAKTEGEERAEAKAEAEERAETKTEAEAKAETEAKTETETEEKNRKSVDKKIKWSIGTNHELTIEVNPGEILYVGSTDAAKQGELWRDLLGIGERKALLEIDAKKILYKHAGELWKERVAFWGTGKEYSEVFENLTVRDNILLPSIKRVSRLGFYEKAAEFIFSNDLIAGENSYMKEAEEIEKKENWSKTDILKIIMYKWHLFHPRVLVANNILSGTDREMKEWLGGRLEKLAERGTAIILLEMYEEDVSSIAGRFMMQ